MFYTRTAIERRGDSASSPPSSMAGDPVMSAEPRARYAAERALDQTLADSFPASDPPSWTPGLAHPARAGPGVRSPAGEVAMEGSGRQSGKVKGGVVDVSFADPRRTFGGGLVSLAGAVGLALLLPFVILLIGLPVALVVRGIAEALARLVARIAG